MEDRPLQESVANALEVVGDRWSFLILREAFFGVRRFNEIRRNLGISRNILTARLEKLTEAGVLERFEDPDHPWPEYRLTEAGRDLWPISVAFMAWGDRYANPDPSGTPPMTLHHTDCGGKAKLTVTCTRCGDPLDIRNVHHRLPKKRTAT